MILTPPVLAEIGAALYGPDWRSRLADRLGVNRRTVTRWLAGDPMPPDLRARMAIIAEERLAELAAYTDELRAVA